MKIAIAINGYKEEKDLELREHLCLKSLKHLRNKYPKNISLYNINAHGLKYKGFRTLHIECTEKFTKVNYLIDVLHKNSNEDVIVLINNDIIVSDELIKQLDGHSETYIASRANIEPIESLSDDLKIVEYSVHGFDLIAVNIDWWSRNRHKFPDMYIGRQYWDTVYFTILMMNSKCKVLNKLPPVIYHPKHETVSNVEDSFDEFNKNVANRCGDLKKWWSYVYNVLLKRENHNETKYWWPFKNETRLERAFFDD